MGIKIDGDRVSISGISMSIMDGLDVFYLDE